MHVHTSIILWLRARMLGASIDVSSSSEVISALGGARKKSRK